MRLVLRLHSPIFSTPRYAIKSSGYQVLILLIPEGQKRGHRASAKHQKKELPEVKKIRL
jgi:hypothetical protein